MLRLAMMSRLATMRVSNFLLRGENALCGIVKENKGCTHLWRDYAHRWRSSTSRKIDIENDSHSHSQHDGRNMAICSLSHNENYVRRYLPHFSHTDNANDSHSHLQIVAPPEITHAPQ